MGSSKKRFNILFLAGISFILIVCIFKSIEFLVKNKYFGERFQQMTYNNNSYAKSFSPNTSSNCKIYFEPFTNQMTQQNNSTSQTVDMPLNTTTSCSNFCSPTSRCAVTGQQCLSDMDCPGCQPNEPDSSNSDCVPGNDDAGKLTTGNTPTYSILTNDIGTKSTTFTRNKFAKPPSPNYGVNIWMSKFKEENTMFKQRYTPSNLQYMPSYPERHSLTGDFVENGPLPSNSFLK